MDSFMKEIDYLAENNKEFDIVFLAVATGSGQRRESINDGLFLLNLTFLQIMIYYP